MLYRYGHPIDGVMYVVKNIDGGRRISRKELVFQGPGMIQDEVVIGR